MAKKLFLSCYSKELDVALELKNNLDYAFKNELAIEAPLDDMKCGDDWREYIKARLSDCEGLITLITPTYSKRAWCTAEFVPFWLDGRKVFPVAIGFQDMKNADIFKLITDQYQIANLEDYDNVEGLLESIAEFCETAKPDVKYLKGIVDGCSRKYKEIVSAEINEETGLAAERVVFFNSDLFIRKYFLNSTIWECRPNQNDKGILSAVCTKEIHFECSDNNFKYMKLPFRALDEADVTFEVLEQDIGDRQISFSPLDKKSESVYAYQIRFKPALKKNDVVKFKYRINVPQYKLATLEKTLEYITKNGKDRKELGKETTSIRVTVPTDELKYKIIISSDCEIVPLEIQPKWLRSNVLNIEELEYLRNNESNYCQNYDFVGGYVMELNRNNPTVGMTYVFAWELPSESDL